MRTIMRRRGYTLVELLVVISIIGILMSLSIPAIVSVKQAMRTSQCAENLRQIAIATVDYELSRDSLPGYCQKFGEFPGGPDPADPGSFAGNVPRHFKIGSWQVAILGGLGHAPFYEQWTLDRYPLLSDGSGLRGTTADGYSTVAAPNLAIYQCPSASGSIAQHGRNNYIANTGMHADSYPFTYQRPGNSPTRVTFSESMSRDNGAFNNRYAGFDPANPLTLVAVGKRIRTSNFKDGAGNTMLVSENQQAQPWHLTRLTGNTAHLTNIVRVGRKEVTAYPLESRYLQGSVWHFEDDQAYAGAPAVAAVHKINGGDVYNTLMNSTNYSDLARPSSLHVGGVNVAMADGSIRFVVETIDYRVYQAMLTPNGRSSDVPMNEFLPTTDL